jgi:hypothetical protein
VYKRNTGVSLCAVQYRTPVRLHIGPLDQPPCNIKENMAMVELKVDEMEEVKVEEMEEVKVEEMVELKVEEMVELKVEEEEVRVKEEVKVKEEQEDKEDKMVMEVEKVKEEEKKEEERIKEEEEEEEMVEKKEEIVEKKEEEEKEDEEEVKGFPYVSAILGGESIKLYPRSLVPAKIANSCGFCRAPFVLGQTQIVKVKKRNNVLWICQWHVNEMIIADDRNMQQLGSDDDLGPDFSELRLHEEERYRVWPHTQLIARFESFCCVLHCNTKFERGESLIVGGKKYNASTGSFTRKLDVFGRETSFLYWLCVSHMN